MASESDFPRFTVSSLTAAVKGVVERGWSRIIVEGEISGWKRYSSGHCYFTLKDEGAQISAVMYDRYFAQCAAGAELKDGVKISVFGNLSVYPQRGQYQLVVLRVKLSGLGELMQKYIELKAKLEKEGLFDPSRKRPLPFVPRRIGLVTSDSGAVVHDMCTVLTRRFPALEIRLHPALVQGAEAPSSLIKGLRYFTTCEWRADLLIIARGGGSFEDLFCFNDEMLVREVASSPIPIISAVGHETDFTLCDFAADMRAGTPSIAAEMAVPLLSDIKAEIKDLSGRASNALMSSADIASQRVDRALVMLSSSVSMALSEGARRLERLVPRMAPSLNMALSSALASIENSRLKMGNAVAFSLSKSSSRFENAKAKLLAYSPYGVLERGYSITTSADGAVICDVSALHEGDVINTRFARGAAVSRISEIANGECEISKTKSKTKRSIK